MIPKHTPPYLLLPNNTTAMMRRRVNDPETPITRTTTEEDRGGEEDVRNSSTRWTDVFASRVHEYVQLREASLLTPHECQDVIQQCATRLRRDVWLLPHYSATYLATEAFGRVYEEHSQRLLREFSRFMQVAYALTNRDNDEERNNVSSSS